jgi:regulator of RNase E activity RraA
MTMPSVSSVADVLGLWGADGRLTPPLRPIVGAPEPVVGRVVTVQVRVGGTGKGFAPLYDVLSRDLTDCFVVVAGAQHVPGAVWGEILTLAARQQHARGVLVHGWVRDVPDLTMLGVPVYALGDHVAGPNGLAHVVGVDVDVSIDDILVAADDHILADATGCARVRANELDAVVAAAQRYTDGERQVAQALAGGEPLASAYRHKKSVVDELRR